MPFAIQPAAQTAGPHQTPTNAASAAGPQRQELARDRVAVETQPEKFKVAVSTLLAGLGGMAAGSAAAGALTMAASVGAIKAGAAAGGLAGAAGALAARKADTLAGSVGYGAAAGAVAGAASMFAGAALTKAHDVKSAAIFAAYSAVVGAVVGAAAGATEHGVSKATDWAESKAKAKGQ